MVNQRKLKFILENIFMKRIIVFLIGIVLFAKAQEIIFTPDDDCPQSVTCSCGDLPQRGQMTYYYYQNTGHLTGGSGSYAINTYGYSGSGTFAFSSFFTYLRKLSQ